MNNTHNAEKGVLLMKIIVFKYGEALYREKRIFSNTNTDRCIPMSFCFYLIQEEHKNILVDTGCEGKEKYKMYVYKNPVELLKEYGLEPEEITDILVTHSHFDHIEGIKPYQNATIHIQKSEYESGKEYINPTSEIHLFDEEFSLCKNICIKKYGGHTEGSCIVFADSFVLCGDECYFRRNLEEKIRTGLSHCPEKSEQFVIEYHNSQYQPLLFHDSSILSGKVGFACVYESKE